MHVYSLLNHSIKIWDLLTWGGEKSYKETRACAPVSLSDFHLPRLKSHILNRMIINSF